MSQLKGLSRTLVSNCPAHGARIVATILNDPSLKSLWVRECAEMCQRLNTVRTTLHSLLVQYAPSCQWDHLLTQRGMFSFTGISPELIALLQRDYHIYMLDNGRISLAGLNTGNIERFAQAVGQVIKQLNDQKTQNNSQS